MISTDTISPIRPTHRQPAKALRAECLRLLQINSPDDKAAQVQRLDVAQCTLDTTETLIAPSQLPGRPERPLLVHPSQLRTRAVGTLQGRAGLIHALTHIEANAINLALDIVWRFAGMPTDFYRDWWRVAQEEALHFELLNAHLKQMGFTYGDFPAHDGLWEMAERTHSDILARLALVPRTLEARGLDATPAVRNRLVSVGDLSAAKILDIILRDEIGHVANGNRWYRYLCAVRQIDPITTYAALAQRYQAPILKGPFNLVARRAAGFSEAELSALQVPTEVTTG
ncbi:ferritin-like domain-containing protein [Rhodoferax sp.]|uniref:ferritin-like domain-containing protein n=1 Tax=Rhodoferax sp. TaxID=50421 RepID=UPI002715B3C0|nr:ferritin-like domain-containing protein [Rhodoferax sp.]MDO8319186.1 ferritin-like domain-containing protein [Rhodoferax sp.]